MFSLWYIDWVGSLYSNRFLYIYFSVLRGKSGPKVKLAGCKSDLTPSPPTPGGLFCWPFYGSGPGVSVTLHCLFYVLPCVILSLCFFSSFSIAITSFGEERASLGAFRTFVWFELVWFCLFPLPLGVWEVLRFMIVALLDFSLTYFFLNILRKLKFKLDSNGHEIVFTTFKRPLLEYGDKLQLHTILKTRNWKQNPN